MRRYQSPKSKAVRGKKEGECEREVKSDLPEGEHWLQ